MSTDDRLRLRPRSPGDTHDQSAALRPSENPRRAGDLPIIRVAEPRVGPREAELVAEVVASTLVSSVSPMVGRFEAALAARCGTTDAVAVTCGTHALDLLMYCFDVGPGDEVIVPALTFISVGACVARAEARPVFVDIDPVTLNVRPEAVEAAVTERTRGIIGVHTYGHPCDMPGLRAVAERHGLFLIEDACEALGAEHRGKPVGGLGDAAVHSFYSNKMMTTGNGGAITTSHAPLAALARELRGYSYAPGRFFWHDHMPFNVRMSGLQAAVGVAQLERLDELVAHHEWMMDAYSRRLRGVPGIQLPAPCEEGRHVYWMVTIHVDEAVYGRSAAELRAALAWADVETRPVFTPLHVQPILQSVGAGQGPFPHAEWAALTGINLPSGATLTEAQVDRVCSVVVDGAARPSRSDTSSRTKDST